MKFKTSWVPHFGFECDYCPAQYAYCFDREEGKIVKIVLPWYALENDTVRDDIITYITTRYGYQTEDIMVTDNDIGDSSTFHCFDMEQGPEK